MNMRVWSKRTSLIALAYVLGSVGVSYGQQQEASQEGQAPPQAEQAQSATPAHAAHTANHAHHHNKHAHKAQHHGSAQPSQSQQDPAKSQDSSSSEEGTMFSLSSASDNNHTTHQKMPRAISQARINKTLEGGKAPQQGGKDPIGKALSDNQVSPSSLPYRQVRHSRGVYDLSPLPIFSGVVAQFLPAIQEGGIIGFILTDGTEVLIPSEASDSILRIVNVGERVDIQGLRGNVLPIVQAFAISTTRGNVSRGDFIEMPQHSREMMAGTDFILHGEVWLPLYNVEGQLCGAVLKDHSVLYMMPAEAVHVADLIQPGKTLYVVGSGSSGDLGLAVDVRELGTSADKLISLSRGTAPPPGPPAGSAAYDVIRGSEEH